MLAEVEEGDCKAVGRYKRLGIKVKLLVETDGYVVGEKYKGYSLTPRHCI